MGISAKLFRKYISKQLDSNPISYLRERAARYHHLVGQEMITKQEIHGKSYSRMQSRALDLKHGENRHFSTAVSAKRSMNKFCVGIWVLCGFFLLCPTQSSPFSLFDF